MDNETAAMDIIGAFDIPGRCIGIKANKQGHINSTFISVFHDGDVERKYTHQRINSTVFPHPEEVMENILRVTEHLAQKTDYRTDGNHTSNSSCGKYTQDLPNQDKYDTTKIATPVLTKSLLPVQLALLILTPPEVSLSK